MSVPTSYMQLPAGGPTQSHLVCGGCHVLLMYPQGAANVRCSRCNHITTAPVTSGADTSQIVCSGCRVLLAYPRGAQSVQCSMCHNVTQVPVYGHLVCNGCSVMLMYPVGAQSVKCSVCHYVTPVTASATGASQQQRPKATTQTVVVENPPTLDDQGNEVANIAVGVKASDDKPN